MKLTLVQKILLLTAAFFCIALRANAQAPEAKSQSLAPIAFFTAHEWDAQLPDSPDGKKLRIHAKFTWAQNGQAIRVSNQFVNDGKAKPYIDGLYVWDPQRLVIAFWYVGADGSFTKGTVRVVGGKLVHEFDEIEPDGKSATYIARVTPHGDQAWENEILASKDGALTPVVKVRYEIAD